MIHTQPEWLPAGQQNIGTALNKAATAWASGELMSVVIVAETISGDVMYVATESEDLLKMIGALVAFSNYISHAVPLDGEELDDHDEEEGDTA